MVPRTKMIAAWTEEAKVTRIRAYADILGSLMQPTDRPSVDYLNMHEFTSSIGINILTLNHGNLTRNPKLDNREVYNMPMKDRPIIKMMMQNSAHILCLNEADAFGHCDQAMVIQTDRMLCPRRTLCKSGTSGKTHFHQEPELGNHIRNVQMFLRNKRRWH